MPSFNESSSNTASKDVVIDFPNYANPDEIALRRTRSTSSTRSKPRVLKGEGRVWGMIQEQREEELKDLDIGVQFAEPSELRTSMPLTQVSFSNIRFAIPGQVDTVKSEQRGKKLPERLILDDCSGSLPAGKLIAIMGPSGCGKSSLLDILAGRKTKGYTGDVHLNGLPRDCAYPLLAAYVPQSDVMPARCTVREAVYFTKNLRTPSSDVLSEEMRNSLCDMMLSDLGLDGVADTEIGDEKVRGISGGQRRRVTLARGAVSGALMLFADEPTSGLSSTDAEIVIRRLKLMTVKHGITVVVVIHQPKPEVANLFDHLLLLAPNPGRVVYNGPMDQAAAHCASAGHPVPLNVSPCDFLLDMVSPAFKGQQANYLANYYKQNFDATVHEQLESQRAAPGLTGKQIVDQRYKQLSDLVGKPVVQRGPHQCVQPVHAQLYHVGRREATLLRREWRQLVIEFCTTLMKACVIGIAFWGIGAEASTDGSTNIFQLNFYSQVLQMACLSQMQKIPQKVERRDLMKFEASDRLYSEYAFIGVSFLRDLLTSSIMNLVFAFCTYCMSQIPLDHFGTFYLWYFLCSLVLDSCFDMVAAIGSTATEAQLLALPFLALFMMFNGVYASINSVQPWMLWANYISPFFYTMQQIAVGTFSGDSLDYVQATYGFKDGWMSIALAVLLGEMLLFRICQVFALVKLNNVTK